MKQNKKIDENTSLKVSFITSYKEYINKDIEITPKKSWMENFDKIFTKSINYNNDSFIVSIFCFTFVQKNLKESDYDKKSKNYKATVCLKHKNNKFEGIILFKKEKNNFIYDFKFNDDEGFISITKPPTSIKFSKLDQLKLYGKYMNSKKIKQDNPLSVDLILDSQKYLSEDKNKSNKNGIYTLEYFLEILKMCYDQKEVKTLLMRFRLERIIFENKMEPKNYSSILNLLYKRPKKIINFCTEKDNKERYIEIFYTLLLYFRSHYEKNKLQELISDNNLWKYFIKIFPGNYEYFSNIEIPETIINNILNQTPLKYEIIIGTFQYLKSIESLLICINNNCESIFKCCMNEKDKKKQMIQINEFVKPNQSDDLSKILKEIEKIINFESNNNKQFVEFNDELWKNYIHFFEKEDLEKILLIKKGILICKKIDKNLNLDYEKLIHEIGIEMINKGKLKNIKLLDFIGKEDIYFKDKKYESNYYRPLQVFYGFDLENVDEEFFKKWEEINIFNIYSFTNINYCQQIIIDKITHMKDFGKLFKIFNYENEHLCDYNSISLVSNKFKSLIGTYTSESCPNFIEETSFLIYILDKRLSMAKSFMENIIEKDIQSSEVINKIYLYLSSNYKDLSNKVLDCITNYFIKKNNSLKVETILFLLKKLNSSYIIKEIFNEVSSYIII